MMIRDNVRNAAHKSGLLFCLLYGSEMWGMTVRSSKRLDAFDQWCLRHILRVPFTAHVTNQEVRLRSAQPPVELGSLYYLCSCHPDGHAQASKVLRPRHPF